MGEQSATVAGWDHRGRLVDRPGGEPVFVRQAGPAVTELAPPLVLIHGAGRSSAVWREIWADVRQGRRLLAPDLPGHGESAGRAAAAVSDHADAVSAVIQAAALGEVDLLTHGMGNLVAAELLARGLEGPRAFEVRRRVVTNGVLYPELVARAADPAEQRIGELHTHASRWGRALEAHPAPLTVLWGDADAVVGLPTAERLHEARPHADFVRLPGVGHAPHLEAASSVARVVLDVLS